MLRPLLTSTAASVFALAVPFASAQEAQIPSTGVPAQAKYPGIVAENVLSPELFEVTVASGVMTAENPSDHVTHFGFVADGPFIPLPVALQKTSEALEATKTEPDKNTFLVLKDQKGGTQGYDYGTHFLFQGHENGAKDSAKRMMGLITRVNLDTDAAHRITILADKDSSGKPLPFIDGSTWDPFAQKLLFTSEEDEEGGVLQASLDVPAKVETLYGIIGHAAYEGVQVDKTGAVWLVEDSSGKKGKVNAHAKQPNSFVYRFTPKDRSDLAKGGRLDALQVLDPSGAPIAFHDGEVDGDITSAGMKALHSYGSSLKTRWILLHDTDTDGSNPFAANALAKTKLATPFKRPENGQFRPGNGFKEFVFTETGDTSAKSEAGDALGGFGGRDSPCAGSTGSHGGFDQYRLPGRCRAYGPRQHHFLGLQPRLRR